MAQKESPRCNGGQDCSEHQKPMISDAPRQPDCARAAQQLAGKGFRVLALRPGEKLPATEHGVKDATSDPEVIARWWEENPQRNLGLATGGGLVVIDLDVDPSKGLDGVAELAKLEAGLGTLPATATVSTPRGGQHRYFRVPADTVIRNSASKLGPGIDVRGEGGYVVAPPSRLPDERCWSWEHDNHGIADLPEEWLAELTTPASAPPCTPPPAYVRARANGATSPWGRTRLEANVAEVTCAAPGSRNVTLNEAAFKVGQAVGSGHIDEEEALNALLDAAVGAGLPEHEARKTIASGLEAGKERSVRPQQNDTRTNTHDNVAGNETDDENGFRRRGKYQETDQGIVRIKPTNNGEVKERLTNFTARITADIIEDDGAEESRVYEIEACISGRKYRKIHIPTRTFSAMNWPADNLGLRAIVEPGYGAKDHARAAIQYFSFDAEERRVYTHTGWRKLPDHGWVYLHAGGAIGASGSVEGVEVNLLATLARYELPIPPEGDELRAALRESLRVLDVAPRSVSLPLYLSIWRAALSTTDFSIHVVGTTGAGKSELAALVQQHWGAGLDARNLPGSYTSTANHLEGMAFKVKDAIFVCDEFTPTGDSRSISRTHATAERFLRGAGNGAGRGRMRADGSLVEGKPPRGLIVSTGEDVPMGESLRARMLIVALEKSDVDWSVVTECQSAASDRVFAQALAAYLKWLAPRLDVESEQWQKRHKELRRQAQASHPRTADTIAQLGATLGLFQRFLCEHGLSAEAEALNDGWSVLLSLASAQSSNQREQNPAYRFVELLLAALESKYCTLNSNDDRVGLGGVIGWEENDDILLFPEAAYRAVNQYASQCGHPLGVQPTTLWKRLGTENLLVSRDKGHRTTRRLNAGQKKRVLHLSRKKSVSYLEKSGPGGPGGPQPPKAVPREPEGPPSKTEAVPENCHKKDNLDPRGPIGPLLYGQEANVSLGDRCGIKSGPRNAEGGHQSGPQPSGAGFTGGEL